MKDYMPLQLGMIYFVGIGGIGMSGIAEVLHALGYSVGGCDMNDSANVKRLRDVGIMIDVGHDAKNITDKDNIACLVVSSAITDSNVELQEARRAMIPVVQRAEMLAELMRLKWSVAIGGTHGKTTTTSLFSHLFYVADLDPTVINGGIINAWNSNARLGSGDWIVAEADESDGSFLKLPATIAVVTNIDAEHMAHYGSMDQLRLAFRQFVQKIPFYGFALICLDHDETRNLIANVRDRRIITYGFSPQAHIRAVNLRNTDDGMCFDVQWRKGSESYVIENIDLTMFGEHNVQNALSAVAVALEMGIGEDKIRHALSSFKGVKRRFTKVDNVNGIDIIDDYGHHPVEIKAVLSTARAVCKGKLIAVMQPHRYSRLYDLFQDFCGCFHDADYVYITDVFAAGEKMIEDYDSQKLVEGIKAQGHWGVSHIADVGILAQKIKESCKDGDMVVFLGAGSITQWAYQTPNKLRGISNDE